MAFETDTSGHWYTPDGRPAHRQPTPGGGFRPTTLADARRLVLLPSVTSILSVMPKPQLDEWKLNQAILSALRTPRQSGEPEDAWSRRVKAGAMAQVHSAAELGSRIHHALDAMYEGQTVPVELQPYINPVAEWYGRTGITVTAREQILVNPAEGFAGTCDVLFTWDGGRGMGILDYKTRRTTPGRPILPYDGQAMQLAAYAATHYGEASLPDVLAANLFISTTEPGRMEVCKHESLDDHWRAFLAAAALWRYQRGYDPRRA